MSVPYQRLDVVLVPFLFSEDGPTARHPAVVVSTTEFSAVHGHCVVAQIVIDDQPGWPSDIPIGQPDSAGIAGPAAVRFKLFTVRHAMILRRLGALSFADGLLVEEALRVQLGA